MQIRYAARRARHAHTDPYLTGWGPTPRSRRSYSSAERRARDHPALLTLRVVAYVLTSLASLLFIALVVYGVVLLYRLQDALPWLPPVPFGG